MKLKILLLSIVIPAIFLDCRSQSFSSINYSIEHGLPQSQVGAITQDGSGYLWVGTATGGLSRFDGKKFVNYTTGHGLLSPAIQCLSWTPERLWIGTARGLNTMVNGQISEHPFVPREEVKKILAHDTLMWAVLSDGGIYQLSGDSGKYYSEETGFTDRRVRDMEYDSMGMLWVLTTGGHVYNFDGEKFALYVTLPDSTTQSILPISNTQLLAGTRQGLITYNVENRDIKVIRTEVPRANIREIHMFDGELWLVMQNGLLWKQADEFKWIASQNGLTNVPVFQIFQDREGIIWAGTNVYGLFKFLRGPFRKLKFPPESFVDIITDIKQFEPGSVLVTTLGKGAFEIGLDFSIQPVTTPPSVRNISNAVMWNGKILLSSIERGILIKSGDTFEPIADQPTYASPPFFINTMNDELFVSDRKSLFSVRESGIEKIIADLFVFEIFQADTTLLLGTDNGLYEFVNGDAQKIKTGHQFDNQLITCLRSDKYGNLLVGTLGHGLWIFPGGRLDHQRPTRLLPVDHITFLFLDGNRIYCGTQRGICIFDYTPELKVVSQKWLNRNNGLLGIETVNETVLQPSFGQELWFGTVDGLFIYDTQEHYPIRSIPLLSITNVHVSGLPDSVQSPGWFKNASIKLPSNVTTLNFEFESVSLLMPDHAKYQYRLIGLSDRWSDPMEQTSIRFTNLAPGHYNFEVRAVNDIGLELDRQTLTFQILTPFWQTGWFRTLLVVLLVMAVWGIMHIRISRAMKVQVLVEQQNRQMRRELAKDFHDELGNHLASIISLLQVIAMKAHDLPDNLSKQFASLNRHANDLFFGTKDFIASIDPHHETLGWTMLYLGDFGEHIFSTTTITFGSPAVESWQNNLKVRSYYSRHLILIFKEAMTNALKHSGASEVNMKVSKSSSDLTIVLSDNGNGFDYGAGKISSVGLKSMEERARKIEAILLVQSSPKGTTITIKKENYAHWAS